MHLTRAGRHFKLPHLEGDHPGRDVNQEIDIEELRHWVGELGREDEEDRVLKQLKKTQANISL